MSNVKMDSYCVLPFNHLSIDPVGQIRPCCNFDIHSEEFRHSDKKLDRFQDGKPVLDGAWHKDLRETILRGERHELCRRCWVQEDNGGTSYRQNYNQMFLFDEHRPPPTDVAIEYIEMTLGNKCNIQCRMCNPWSSSMWLDDILKNPELDYWQAPYKQLQTAKWYEHERFDEVFESVLPTVKHINFLGGEPLFNEKYYEVMDRVIASGRAHEISIQFNTNGLAIQNKSRDVWAQLKKVGFNLSCDGVGRVNEYVRWPGKWSKWERNMAKLQKWRTELDSGNGEMWHKWTFQLHGTLSTLTWLDIGNLILYTDNFKDHAGLGPFVIQVNQPTYMDAVHLPDEIKELGAKRIADAIKQVRTNKQPDWDNLNNIESLVKHVMNTPRNQYQWQDFINETNKLDRVRGENILEVIPEYEPYWNAST